MNCLRSRRQHQSVWIDHAESASTYDNETKSLVRLGFEGVRLLEMADGIELGLSHQSPQLVVGQLFKFLVKLAQWEESNDLVIKTGPLNALDSISYPHHGLRGFPGRLGRLKDPVPHDYAHDARLMQLYYTIRLIIFMTILGNPGLRLVLRNTAQVSQSIDEWSTEEATLEAIISRLTKEADTAANYICMYAQILFPTVGATFGYMYELWALETVSEWHQQSLSSDKTPTAEGNSHRYIDICRSIIPLIKLRMSDKVIRADSSG